MADSIQVKYKHSQETIDKIRLANTGKKRTEAQKLKFRNNNLGSKSNFWRGGTYKNSKNEIHRWVESQRGLAKTHICEECFKNIAKSK